MKDILLQTENLLKLRNYSQKTRKSYLFYISKYLEFSKKKISRVRMRPLSNFIKNNSKKPPKTINPALNSIFFIKKY